MASPTVPRLYLVVLKKHKVPVIVLTGKIGEGIEPICDLGVTAIHSIVDKPMDLTTALKNADVLIERCAENVMRTIQILNKNKHQFIYSLLKPV